MTTPGQHPSFAPRLPPALTRLTFTVILRGRHLRVEVMPGNATYILDGEGPPLEITHYGTPVAAAPGRPETRDIPVLPVRPRPSQPPGREPPPRGRAGTPKRAAPGRRGRSQPARRGHAEPPQRSVPAQPAGEAAPAGP